MVFVFPHGQHGHNPQVLPRPHCRPALAKHREGSQDRGARQPRPEEDGDPGRDTRKEHGTADARQAPRVTPPHSNKLLGAGQQ